MNDIIKDFKKSKNLNTFQRKVNKYKYINVENYNDLKPMTYTILLKPKKIITKIKNRIESSINLKRGDYVLCGKLNEKYGLSLEKILNTYDLGQISNKKITRKGFKLSHSFLKKNKLTNKINITPSWGGKQHMFKNDYILFETNNIGYYGITKKAFEKDYLLK